MSIDPSWRIEIKSAAGRDKFRGIMRTNAPNRIAAIDRIFNKRAVDKRILLNQSVRSDTHIRENNAVGFDANIVVQNDGFRSDKITLLMDADILTDLFESGEFFSREITHWCPPNA